MRSCRNFRFLGHLYRPQQAQSQGRCSWIGRSPALINNGENKMSQDLEKTIGSVSKWILQCIWLYVVYANELRMREVSCRKITIIRSSYLAMGWCYNWFVVMGHVSKFAHVIIHKFSE